MGINKRKGYVDETLTDESSIICTLDSGAAVGRDLQFFSCNADLKKNYIE